MSTNPIYYKDLVSPDDSIRRLIGELKELNTLYSEVVSTVKSSAIEIQTSIKTSSGATKEGREFIEKAASSTDRLKRAQGELKFAMSDTGKQVAWLKSQISETNRITVTQKKQLEASIGSYEKLKSSLKNLVSAYKNLSAAEREEAQVGGVMLNSILRLKESIAQLDAQMKPYIQSISALEKAKQKLAYLQSNEGKELMEVNAQIRAITQGRKQQKATIDALALAQEKLKNAQSEENGQLRLYSTLISQANRVAQLNAQIANSAEGSYDRLSAQYALNKIKLNQMSGAEREAADAGKKLEAETNALYQQMIKLQEATGNHRLSVGNYKRAWDGLGVSVNQIIRELPAAAISLNTFFLGISNNIPLLVDEIQRLREQNKAFKAEGKPTKSVIGSIVKSLVSWNSILVVMLTVFAMHGEAIIEWVASIFKGKESVISLEEALQNVNKELENTNDSYGSNLVALKKLKSEYAKLTSDKQRIKWIEENKSKFDKLGVSITGVSEAENLLVKNTESFVESLKARAKAAAAMKLAADSYEKALIKENEANIKAEKDKDLKPRQTNKQGYAGALGGVGAMGAIGTGTTVETADPYVISQKKIAAMRKEAKVAEQTGDAYFKLAEAYGAEADAALSSTGLRKSKKSTKAKKELDPRDIYNQINSLNLKVRKKYEESLTKLEEGEFVKRRKGAVSTYNVNTLELRNMLERNKKLLAQDGKNRVKLSDEQKEKLLKDQAYIAATLENEQNILNKTLRDIERDYLIDKLNTRKEYIDLELKAVKEGSMEELSLRLQALDAEKNLALAQNAKLQKAQQKDHKAISKGYDKQAYGLIGSFALTEFDKEQALQEARFNIIERDESDLTKFKLQQERDRWAAQIKIAEAGGLDWSKKEIGAAKATIEGLDRQIADIDNIWAQISKRGVAGGLLDHLGFSDKQIDALTEAGSIVIDQLGAILEAEVALAEKEVELAQQRVDAAKSAYDAEIEARNNGYAHSVDTAKKELLQEQKNQTQKEKILAAAQRRQEALNSITQASSLITASANLWSAFSSVPIVGPALAIAAIATMWGSFAAAKIKANQVTAVQEYGEGGLEFLEGGSHASGNDIDLGVSNKRNRRMKAEGGEALAIINKHNTKRYRKLLPDVINSLNKGTFEEKFLKAFDAPQNMLISNNNLAEPANLSTLEKGVNDIKEQGRTKYFSLSDGSIVIIKNNVKRIIRK